MPNMTAASPAMAAKCAHAGLAAAGAKELGPTGGLYRAGLAGLVFDL
jgi:hypothetical protein